MLGLECKLFSIARSTFDLSTFSDMFISSWLVLVETFIVADMVSSLIMSRRIIGVGGCNVDSTVDRRCAVF